MKLRNAVIILTLAAICTVVLAGLVSAQQMKTMTFNADDMYLIPGLGAGITLEEDNLKVMFLMPSEQRPKEFQKVDLQEGDKILMLNGKRVRTIVELREQMESIKVGDPVELGIKRDNAMMIVAFDRPDEEQQGGGKIMMVTNTIGSDDEGHGKDHSTPGTITTMGTNAFPLMEAGVILGDGESGANVIAEVGGMESEMTGDPLAQSDLIVTLQGNKIASLDDFTAAYKTIETGAMVKIDYMRDGKKHTVSFVKPKMRQMIQINPESASPE